MAEALELARRNLRQLALDRHMEDYADEAEVFLQEQFNVIRGGAPPVKYSTSGCRSHLD